MLALAKHWNETNLIKFECKGLAFSFVLLFIATICQFIEKFVSNMACTTALEKQCI